jgi:adenosylcobinamide kinase / adenosylcobinamide-phosphate guanylyltransferase
LCEQTERVVYIATAVAGDDEMRERIARHQASRPAFWITIEEPLKMTEMAARHVDHASIVLIDCLTIWLSNLLFERRSDEPAKIEREALERTTNLIAASKRGNIIAVTNEVGSGIVPESPVARQFRDLQGFVNQQVARAADFVYLIVSGIPMRLKPAPGVSQ